jgi:tetratricopeptide (TPR) repeat protein
LAAGSVYTIEWLKARLYTISALHQNDANGAEWTRRLEEVREATSVIEREAPKDAAALRGLSYQLEGRWPEALQEYTKPTKDLPSLAAADRACFPLLIGEVECRLHSADGATVEALKRCEKLAERAIKLAESSPDIPASTQLNAYVLSADVCRQIADALFEVRKKMLSDEILDYHKAVIAQYTKATKIDPDHREAWRWHLQLGMSNLYLMWGAESQKATAKEYYDAATKHYSRASLLNPKQSATIEVYQRDLDNAARHLKLIP